MDEEPRVDPPVAVDERGSLAAFPDQQRAAVLYKAQGLTKEQLGRAALPTTTLTQAGLVEHLALVEDSWVQERFLGLPPEPGITALFEADEDWDFHGASDHEPAELSTGQ